MAKALSRALLLAALFVFFFNPFASGATDASSLIASIDCGSSNSYTDDLGIPWTSDSSLIKTGNPETVPNAASFSQPMQTLREFSTGKTNCYTIDIPDGKQVLVRASFFYGNYDGKNSPPTFDLEFDGNSWSTVETSTDAVISEEVIYVARGGSTSLCVVQTKTGDLPFVSAIEVRGLEDSMYSYYDHNSSALVLSMRKVAGLTAAVRYPDDAYDRIWLPLEASNGVDVVQNQANVINTSISDLPPATIFQAAITPTTGSSVIGFTVDTFPSNPIKAYINMYFTEVTLLAGGHIRTFEIYINNITVSGPVAPAFGGTIEFEISNFSASSSTEFTLQPTEDATLPPVISAMEAYVIINLTGAGGGAAPTPSAEDSPPPSSDNPPVSNPPPPSSDSPPVSNPPPPSDDSSPGSGNESPSDTTSPATGDQTNSPPPPAQSIPAGSAFGAGRKGAPSLGHLVMVSKFVQIGVGIIVSIFFLNFV